MERLLSPVLVKGMKNTYHKRSGTASSQKYDAVCLWLCLALNSETLKTHNFCILELRQSV